MNMARKCCEQLVGCTCLLLISYRPMFFYRLETSAPGLSGNYWYSYYCSHRSPLFITIYRITIHVIIVMCQFNHNIISLKNLLDPGFPHLAINFNARSRCWSGKVQDPGITATEFLSAKGIFGHSMWFFVVGT